MMRLDLHVHTYHSSDCVMAPDQIIAAVQRRGLDGLAITDHNTITGAVELGALAPFPVIVGEEIKTVEGEITGLFLRNPVPPGLSPEETVAAIHDQGGLVYLPHPFDSLRRSVLRRAALDRILAQVDVLEVFNARVTWPLENRRARQFALAHGLAMGAGSDAHVPCEIGHGLVEVGVLDGPASFLAALRRGQATGVLTTPLIHIVTTLTKLRSRLTGRHQPK